MRKIVVCPCFLVLSLLLAAAAHGAPDEDQLGKAQGYPVCMAAGPAGGYADRCMVGAFSHYERLVPARTVAKAAAQSPLARAASEPRIAYSHRGQARTVDAFLASNRNTGLLILSGDRILVERYQYGRTADDRFQSMSMAKTVVAMLIGIALQENKISSIDDLAAKYVPELKGHPYGETSLRHLLTMSSGVRFTERYDGTDDNHELVRRTLLHQGRGGADALEPFRGQPRDYPAGTHFHYASAESEVLGLVLRAAVGKPLADYLSEKIWQPMGAEADATWCIDAGGYETGYVGINATLRDWARFGRLLANDGELNGRQIIPAAWVRAATTAESPHLAVGTATKHNGYGYQTWLVSSRARLFAALGLHGQAIFVDPATKLVIVHTGVYPKGPEWRDEQFSLFFGTDFALKAAAR